MAQREDMPDHPHPALKDAEWLVRSIRSGNSAAFEVVFRHYYARLCTFAEQYVHSPDVAEDLIHNVFTRMWECRATLDITGTLDQYLYGAARNQALHYLRHEGIARRTQEFLIPLGEPVATGKQPEEPDKSLQSEEIKRALRNAVNDLPHRCKMVFILKWQHHLSYDDIAATLDISRKTVENQLAIAIKALRKNLESWR